MVKSLTTIDHALRATSGLPQALREINGQARDTPCKPWRNRIVAPDTMERKTGLATTNGTAYIQHFRRASPARYAAIAGGRPASGKHLANLMAPASKTTH